MKTWALAAVTVVLSGLAVVACGNGGSGNTGGGGSGTTSHVSSTHSTTSVTVSTSGTGDPCADGSDCTQCADFNTCAMCEQGNHPEGSMTFNNLVTCVYCTACYTVCDGTDAGCMMAPASKDACDMGTPSTATMTSTDCVDPSKSPETGC